MDNIKAYKSTVLGLAIIVFSSILIYKNISQDYWINGILYFIGLGLFFSGDGFINRFQNFVFGMIKNNFSKKEDQNGNGNT